MTVNRNQRTYPLALKSAASFPINAGITAAYDWAGNPDNSYAGGDGAPHAGTWTITKDTGADFPVVQVATGIFGRDISQNMRTDVRLAYKRQYFDKLGIGSADGKGPFTIWNRYRTPSAYTASTGQRTLATYVDSGGVKTRLVMVDDPGGFVYFAWEMSGSYNSALTLPPSGRFTDPAFRVPHNTIVDLHVVRNGDNITAYMNGVSIGTISAPTYVADNLPWTGSAAGQHGFTGATPANVILIDMTTWNRALSDAEVAQQAADPYNAYANTGTATPPPPTTTKPAAPTAVVATAGVNTLSVNATVGSNGGAAITSFTARVYRASDNVQVANVAASALPINVTGLAGGVQVYARLTATNSVGESDPSATSNLATPTNPAVEPPPTEPPAGTTAVRFDFTATYSIEAAEVDLGITGVAISPAQTTIEGGATHQFNAVVTGASANKTVTWSTTSTSGAAGTVNTFGTFTAPAATDADQEFKVRATSDQDPTKWAEATVLVLALVVDEVTSVSISPLSVTVAGNSQLQLQAVVNGPKNPSQEIDWTASGGTITSAGLLTAPAGTAFDQTIKVRATSALDPQKWAEATVLVAAVPVDAVESVTVNPAVLTAEGGETVQFSAEVTGPDAPSQDVTWEATLGTIDNTGTITVPASQSREQVVTITATSSQDPRKKGTAVLIVKAGMVSSFIPSTSRQVRILPGRNAFAVGSHWTLGAAGPVGSKDPQSSIDIPFDWTEWLADIGNPGLAKVEFLLGGGLVSDGVVPNTKGGTVVVSGGSLQQTGTVTCRITTATQPSRIEDRTVVLQMKEQ